MPHEKLTNTAIPQTPMSPSWWVYGLLIISSASSFLVAFSRNERTHPISFRRREKSRYFCEAGKLATPLGFFRGLGPRFRVHRFKSAGPATPSLKNTCEFAAVKTQIQSAVWPHWNPVHRNRKLRFRRGWFPPSVIGGRGENYNRLLLANRLLLPSRLLLVRGFLCPCVGPIPFVGLTLTWSLSIVDV